MDGAGSTAHRVAARRRGVSGDLALRKAAQSAYQVRGCRNAGHPQGRMGLHRFRSPALRRSDSGAQRRSATSPASRRRCAWAPSDTSSCTSSTTSRMRGGEFASSDRTPSSIAVGRSRGSPGSGDALSPALAATLAVVRPGALPNKRLRTRDLVKTIGRNDRCSKKVIFDGAHSFVLQQSA